MILVGLTKLNPFANPKTASQPAGSNGRKASVIDENVKVENLGDNSRITDKTELGPDN